MQTRNPKHMRYLERHVSINDFYYCRRRSAAVVGSAVIKGNTKTSLNVHALKYKSVNVTIRTY